MWIVWRQDLLTFKGGKDGTTCAKRFENCNRDALTGTSVAENKEVGGQGTAAPYPKKQELAHARSVLCW